MSGFFLAAVSSFWLGILTSISPCPMATNIASISFIGKRVGNPQSILVSGLLYTTGRMFAYVTLGVLLIGGLLSIPGVSNFLQKYMNRFLGPILIIAGMFLLELLYVEIPGMGSSGAAQKYSEKAGFWGAGILGILFALSFCPISAALFFGSLIPLSVQHGSWILFPSLYGVGTGLPVVFFAALMAFGAQSLGKAFSRLTRIEWWTRRITGVIFIGVGIYYSLKYIFGVL